MALRIYRYTYGYQNSLLFKNVNITSRNQITGTVRSNYYSNNRQAHTTTVKLTEWKSWQKILVRFAPVGLCLVAVMQWRSYRKSIKTRVANQWEVDMYRALPLRAFSRAWGWLADKELPVLLRPMVYGLYARMFKVNVEEAESSNFDDYPSLADFFARGLKPGSRIIDQASCLVSPCDGKVLHFGPVNTCTVEQVKGVTYPLEEFLGDATWLNKPKNCPDIRTALLERPEDVPTTLYQCVLYLAPGDYHRFHSPADWRPLFRRHFVGELLSVSPTVARWIPGLFCLNERAVYLGNWQHGFFSLTAVGATNVGSVKVYFDDDLHTNKKHKHREDGTCEPFSWENSKIFLKKGEPLGEFRMGSTIVLLFEAPINFNFHLKTGDIVRMGQAIGSFKRHMLYEDVLEPTRNRQRIGAI